MLQPSATHVNVVIPPLAQPLLYRVPDSHTTKPGIGARVEVPLGSRVVMGFVVSLAHEAEAQTVGPNVKDIEAETAHQAFHPEQLDFFRRIADYYGEVLSNVIDTAIPTPVSARFKKTVSLAAASNKELRGKLERAIVAKLSASGSQALDYSVLLKQIRGAGPALKRLAQRGLVNIAQEELAAADPSLSIPDWARTEVTLNEAQRAAVGFLSDLIRKRQFSTVLLHGVTGSGKTEVYIRAIQTAQALGLGALVIVPEIALTPQLIDRFRARLGPNLAVLHSALQRRSRWDAWRSLVDGRCQLALGVRSGIYAPIRNLGLIVVDEEHDTSFKQHEGLRYNARDLAVMRGHLCGCPVILGSATPSLESLHNVRTKKYFYLSLPSRPEKMGQVHLEIVDLGALKPWEMPSRNISPRLLEALSHTMAEGEQAFILYNKRGFASFLQCERCESVLNCPNCSVSFTYHQSTNSLLCHYCNLSIAPPAYCNKCGPSDSDRSAAQKPARLVQRGAGTERVFEELQLLFPSLEIDRLDRDAVSDSDSYRQILDRVRSGHTRILVGTQMIAKGHDLPGVTLVGVVDCDVGLHLPDFRAQERVFQLLTQAGGRAGRGLRPGTVILQTRAPDSLSLRCAVRGDYMAFAANELRNREALGYPPFRRMLRIIASSSQPKLPAQTLESFRNRVNEFNQQQHKSFTVLGPSPAPIERIKTEWRWHLLIKSAKPADLNALVRALRSLKVRSSRVKLAFDVDPQDML